MRAMGGGLLAMFLMGSLAISAATPRLGRELLQTQPVVYQGTPQTITVNASNPNVNAITITPVIPYPQNAYYCNITGDSRLAAQGPFPLTVLVPVGVSSTVVFANVTGPIPGTSCTAGTTVVQQSTGSPSSSVVQQQTGSSVVQQQSTPSSSVVQQQSTPSSSVVQQQSTPSSVVQQQATSSVVQQGPSSSVTQYASVNQQNPSATQYMNCVGNTTSVVQQGPASSVVQQSSPPSPPSSVVQQQTTPSSVVQQQTTSQKSPPPPATTVVQQQSSSSVVQQTAGRHLLQVGTIEYISNNGSTGEPQLSVLDTVEGVPSITFTPTAVNQTASFSGGLQVAITTTHDGFGTPYLPYTPDLKLSPQCNVQVIFKAIAASSG